MQFTQSEIINRLEGLGYTIKPSDNYTLGFLMEKIENEILNFCNVDELPIEAVYVAIDMVCGEFLLGKKSSGDLILNGIDLNQSEIKSISEGDTSISYDNNSQNAAQKTDMLISSLIDSKRSLHKFRRLAW